MRFPFLHLSVPGHKHPTWKKARPGLHGEDDFGVVPPAPVRRRPMAPQTPAGYTAPGAPSPIQHLIPPLATLKAMSPSQLTALYSQLPPGSQIAGFPKPNASYFPNPDGTNPATHPWPSGAAASTAWHSLIPPLAQLKQMSPGQLSALYATLPPGAQIAGFPPPNASYFPNPDGTNPAPGWRSSQHQPHGEDAGDSSSPGATDSNSPNYGSGSFAVDTDPMVGDVEMMVGQVHGIGTPGSFAATLAGGGIGAGSMSVLPGQHGMPYDGYLSPGQVPDDYTDDPHSAYQPFADDPYSPPLREPNRRNYKAEFGDEVGFEHELFSGFGVAAMIGGEEDLIVAGDIGCANDTAVRG